MSEEIKNTSAENSGDTNNQKDSRAVNSSITEFRAKMAERGELADKNAAAEISKKDYEDAYRIRLSARESKKAEADKEKKRLLEEERKKELSGKREQEINEYIERERLEAEKRSLHAKALLEKAGENNAKANAEIKTGAAEMLADAEGVIGANSDFPEKKEADAPAKENTEPRPESEEKASSDGIITINVGVIGGEGADGHAQPVQQPVYTYPPNPAVYYAPMPGYIPPYPQAQGYIPPNPYLPNDQNAQGYIPQNPYMPNDPNAQAQSAGFAPADTQGYTAAPPPPVSAYNPSGPMAPVSGYTPNAPVADGASEEEKNRLIAEREKLRSEYDEQLGLYRGEEKALIEEEQRLYREETERLRRERERLASERDKLDSRFADSGQDDGQTYVHPSSDADKKDGSDKLQRNGKNGFIHVDQGDLDKFDRDQYIKELKRKKDEKGRAKKNGSAEPDPNASLSGEPAGQNANLGGSVPRYNVRAVDRGTEYTPDDSYIPNEPEYSDIDLTVDVTPKGKAKEASPDREIHIKTSEMYKRLKKLHKDESALVAERDKLAKKSKKESMPEIVRTMTEIHSLSVRILRISQEQFLVTLYASNKKEIKEHKKLFTTRIKEYNGSASALKDLIDIDIKPIDTSVIAQISETRMAISIPDVRFVAGEAADSKSNTDPEPPFERSSVLDISEPEENKNSSKKNKQGKKDIEDEYKKLLRDEEEAERRRRREYEDEADKEDAENAKEKRENDKKRAADAASCRKAMETDEALIAARSEHRITMLMEQRDAAEYSFSVSNSNIKRKVSGINSDIAKEKKLMRRAVKCEKEQNERYYRVLLLPDKISGLPRNTSPNDLRVLKERIRAILAERDEINERLLALYGSDKAKDSDVKTEKISEIKRRNIRTAYKQQKHLAKRIGKMQIKDERKNRIFDIMNDRTERLSDLEGMKFTLKKTKSKAERKELNKKIKRTKIDIKRLGDDIKYEMKQAEKHAEKGAANREWLGWVIGVGIVVIAGIAVWFFAGDTVLNFINGKFGA